MMTIYEFDRAMNRWAELDEAAVNRLLELKSRRTMKSLTKSQLIKLVEENNDKISSYAKSLQEAKKALAATEAELKATLDARDYAEEMLKATGKQIANLKADSGALARVVRIVKAAVNGVTIQGEDKYETS